MLGIIAAALALPLVKQDPKLPERRTLALSGWTVHLDVRLDREENRSLQDKSLRLLGCQLHRIEIALSPAMVTRLRKVPIFLDFACGDLFSPAYHPSADWLRQNGFSTAMERSVHIPKAEYFVAKPFQVQQPFGMLHEFAHAFHHQELSWDNPRIVSMFEKFRDTKAYETVLHVDGRRTKHYGQSNPMEFFAEMSEAYVGTNDFYPFVRGELKEAEPEIYALMEEVWGK